MMCIATILMSVRLHYPGTNRGDCIYGVRMPSFDGANVWEMTLGGLSINFECDKFI